MGRQRWIGYTLIVFGFLLGAYVSVEQPEGVETGAFVGALVAGFVGVGVLQRLRRAEAGHAETVDAKLDVLTASLDRVVEEARDLDATKDDVDVYDLRHEIDRRFPRHLDDFVTSRAAIGHRWGLAAYADVMNPFAAGERYLNRVWSTSTDGYIDEAHASMAKAREQLEQARDVLRRLAEKG